MSEQIRKSLIATLTGHIQASPGTAQFKSQCIQKLETLNRDQLEELLAKTVQEHAQALQQSQDALLEAKAQRAAEAALFDLQVNAPKRQQAQQEQVNRDVQTFAAAAKELRTVGITEANFTILLESIGQGFTLEAAKAFIEHSGSTMMSAPSRHELAQWSMQDDQQCKQAEADRVTRLKHMPHEQLREEVRQSGQEAHAAAAQAHAQQQIQAMEQKCDGQFPPIPTHNANGEAMDSSYFIRIANAPHGSEQYNLFRRLIKKHGFALVTRRLNGQG
jgi:hypothetical protein